MRLAEERSELAGGEVLCHIRHPQPFRKPYTNLGFWAIRVDFDVYLAVCDWLRSEIGERTVNECWLREGATDDPTELRDVLFTIQGHLDRKGLGKRLDELSELGVTGAVVYSEMRPRRRGTSGTTRCVVFAPSPLGPVTEITGVDEGETPTAKRIHPPRRNLLDGSGSEGGQQ
jgi:hypothetical protein